MQRDGVPEGDKKRLYQHARLALHEMDAVNNLLYLGVNVSKVRPSRMRYLRRGTDDFVQDSGKKRKPLFKQRNEDDAYDISRYQPTIKYMLEVSPRFVCDRLLLTDALCLPGTLCWSARPDCVPIRTRRAHRIWESIERRRSSGARIAAKCTTAMDVFARAQSCQ
jgi:hypothetical protein